MTENGSRRQCGGRPHVDGAFGVRDCLNGFGRRVNEKDVLIVWILIVLPMLFTFITPHPLIRGQCLPRRSR
jgi:hypothetical protein